MRCAVGSSTERLVNPCPLRRACWRSCDLGSDLGPGSCRNVRVVGDLPGGQPIDLHDARRRRACRACQASAGTTHAVAPRYTVCVAELSSMGSRRRLRRRARISELGSSAGRSGPGSRHCARPPAVLGRVPAGRPATPECAAADGGVELGAELAADPSSLGRCMAILLTRPSDRPRRSEADGLRGMVAGRAGQAGIGATRCW